jgi:hypothetical protein
MTLRFARPVLPTACLFLALPLAGVAQEQAPADPITRSVTTTVDRDVTQNEDGSRTLDTSVVHTNDATGLSWSRDTSATVVKTDAGRSWESSTTRTGPQGGTLETSASGSVTKNEDGSRTLERTATTTNPKTGESVTRNVERTATKTEDGVDWTTNRSTDTSRGGHYESTTSGSARKNEDGSRSFETETQGSGTDAKGNEHAWQTERSGSSKRNDQGGRDFESSRTTTTADGKSWGVDRQGSSVKNADGSRTRSTTIDRHGDAPQRKAGAKQRRKE